MACFDFVGVLLNYKHWKKTNKPHIQYEKRRLAAVNPFYCF